ncbi:hypothetical protein G7074_19150 [Pedobacter sp. HDW13]|uniref:hypothetical protein n=1 Tax=Pedobacter sp. HDW13 TaxID=2714940 RepID=UPI00140B7EE9|nr:hypothetical protein [Pedobacter sp. HDW13]QIL41196.1 hypothetical protein G7074_19150 [Pedobacter sp. HDW13]
MIDVTVLPITYSTDEILTSIDKLMNERLDGLASDLQHNLGKVFAREREYDDLVIYLSYNSKYTVLWEIVNDVPAYVQGEVAKYCGDLGYLQSKANDL